MSLAFNIFMKRLRRLHKGKSVEWAMVWERTKGGWPHIHCLLRAPYTAQAWISETWEELTGAKIVDIRRVYNSNQAVAYLAKYLAKSPQCPAGMKRYRISHGFLSQKEKSAVEKAYKLTSTFVVPVTLEQYRKELEYKRYSCHLDSDGRLIAFPPFANPNLPFGVAQQSPPPALTGLPPPIP